MASLAGLSTSKHLTPMLWGRPTIPNPTSTRPDRYLPRQRRSSTPWIVIIVSLLVRRIATTPPLSHGADIGTALLHYRYITSEDGYTRQYDEIVSTIPDKTKRIDDTLLWANSYSQLSPSHRVARHLWQPWSHIEPRKISIWHGHNRFFWIWDHHCKCSLKQ